MLKYNLPDQAKRLSGEDHDFSSSTDDTSSTGEFSFRSSKPLNFCEEECMAGLRQFCTKEGIEVSEQRLFRFACYHQFDLEKTKEAVFESKDNAFLDLEMRSSLRSEFATKKLFPLTGLRTKHNSQVIYSRPSRSDVSEDHMTKVLESLCYMMNDFSQTEQQCRDGIALVTNLKGFKMEHFDEQEWHQFITALQGALVPTKVTSVLLVNAPSWFQKGIWKRMKSSMPYQFRRNVHIITSDKLGDYLMEDYKAYLPSELSHGYQNTEEIIEDYIDLKSLEDRNKVR